MARVTRTMSLPATEREAEKKKKKNASRVQKQRKSAAARPLNAPTPTLTTSGSCRFFCLFHELSNASSLPSSLPVYVTCRHAAARQMRAKHES